VWFILGITSLKSYLNICAFPTKTQGSSVSTLTRVRDEQLGFNSRQRQGLFLFATASRPAPGPTQPPGNGYREFLPRQVKRPGREADLSPPSSAEVDNKWNYNSTSQYVFIAWCLVKYVDNFLPPLRLTFLPSLLLTSLPSFLPSFRITA